MIVRVGHVDYAVEQWDGARDGYEGWHDAAQATIGVNVQAAPAMVAETMIHEVLHACWLQAGLPGRCVEERAVNGLAKALAGVIRDNPALMAWLGALLEGEAVKP